MSYNTFDYKIEDADGVQTNTAFAADVPKEMQEWKLGTQRQVDQQPALPGPQEHEVIEAHL